MPAPASATESPRGSNSLEEQIQRQAYERYAERGNHSGSELDDWLQVEKEILQAQQHARGSK